MERIQSGELDAMTYYPVERIDSHTARLIGYIDAEVFDEIAEFVVDAETYRAEEDGYDFTSRANNLVVEPEELWLSFRDD